MEKKYKVISKYNGYVSVSLVNSGFKYIWNGIDSIKELTLNELKEILNTPGGRDILENKVIINDVDVLKELNLDVEPEYFYTQADISNLLKNGSIAQLKDTIDFAPEGTVALIVETATQEKLEDRNKLQVIKDMTGYDVETMINLNAEAGSEKDTEEKTRRTSVYKTEETSTAPQQTKYKRL